MFSLMQLGCYDAFAVFKLNPYCIYDINFMHEIIKSDSSDHLFMTSDSLISHWARHVNCTYKTQASCSRSRQLCSHYNFILCLSFVSSLSCTNKRTNTQGNLVIAFSHLLFTCCITSAMNHWWFALHQDYMRFNSPLVANRRMWIIDTRAMSEGKSEMERVPDWT